MPETSAVARLSSTTRRSLLQPSIKPRLVEAGAAVQFRSCRSVFLVSELHKKESIISKS